MAQMKVLWEQALEEGRDMTADEHREWIRYRAATVGMRNKPTVHELDMAVAQRATEDWQAMSDRYFAN